MKPAHVDTVPGYPALTKDEADEAERLNDWREFQSDPNFPYSNEVEEDDNSLGWFLGVCIACLLLGAVYLVFNS